MDKAKAAGEELTKKVITKVNGNAALKVVVIVVIIAALVGLAAFLAFWVWRRSSTGGVTQDQVVIYKDESGWSLTGSRDVTGLPQTPSAQLSYTIGINIHNVYNTSSGKILFSRGGDGTNVDTQNMIVFLDKNYNDVLVAFKTNNANGAFSEKFCIFRLENVPIYRWTVLHIIVDQDTKMAKLYIDGQLRKLCNLFSCTNNIIDRHSGINFSWGKMISNDQVTITQSPTPSTTPLTYNSAPAQYAVMYMRNRAMDPNEVDIEARYLLDYIAKLQDKFNKGLLASTCNVQS